MMAVQDGRVVDRSYMPRGDNVNDRPIHLTITRPDECKAPNRRFVFVQIWGGRGLALNPAIAIQHGVGLKVMVVTGLNGDGL